MEENLKEKEFYKGSIMGLLENIDNEEILSFIYVFINGIVEREKRK